MEMNEQQRAVVNSPLENALVLAGAGTGKTTLLVERMVRLVGKDIIKASQIMAITFTRKAAGEIKERTKRRLSESNAFSAEEFVRTINTGTFHSVFSNILRQSVRKAENIDLPPNYTVISPETSKTYTKINEGTWSDQI